MNFWGIEHPKNHHTASALSLLKPKIKESLGFVLYSVRADKDDTKRHLIATMAEVVVSAVEDSVGYCVGTIEISVTQDKKKQEKA